MKPIFGILLIYQKKIQCFPFIRLFLIKIKRMSYKDFISTWICVEIIHLDSQFFGHKLDQVITISASNYKLLLNYITNMFRRGICVGYKLNLKEYVKLMNFQKILQVLEYLELIVLKYK